MDKAHPKVGEPGQGAGNREQLLLDSCFWVSLVPARTSFQQLCVGWKGNFLLAVPFPGMREEGMRNEEQVQARALLFLDPGTEDRGGQERKLQNLPTLE